MLLFSLLVTEQFTPRYCVVIAESIYLSDDMNVGCSATELCGVVEFVVSRTMSAVLMMIGRVRGVSGCRLVVLVLVVSLQPLLKPE